MRLKYVCRQLTKNWICELHNLLRIIPHIEVTNPKYLLLILVDSSITLALLKVQIVRVCIWRVKQNVQDLLDPTLASLFPHLSLLLENLPFILCPACPPSFSSFLTFNQEYDLDVRLAEGTWKVIYERAWDIKHVQTLHYKHMVVRLRYVCKQS